MKSNRKGCNTCHCISHINRPCRQAQAIACARANICRTTYIIALGKPKIKHWGE